MTVRDVDLARLRELQSDPTTKVYRGKLYGQATFAAKFPKDAPKDDVVRAIHGSGELEFVDGDMYKIPVMKDIFGAVGLKQAATVGDGAALFDVADGTVTLRDAAVNAPALGLQGGGKISLVDGKLDLNVVAAPLADWRDKLKETKIPIISDVAGEVIGGVQKLLNTATGTLLYQFKIGGTAKKVAVTPVPAPVLTNTAAFVFGKMLAPQKDQRPLDLLHQQQQSKDQRRAEGR
jgi:hypothetical protein